MKFLFKRLSTILSSFVTLNTANFVEKLKKSKLVEKSTNGLRSWSTAPDDGHLMHLNTSIVLLVVTKVFSIKLS